MYTDHSNTQCLYQGYVLSEINNPTARFLNKFKDVISKLEGQSYKF